MSLRIRHTDRLYRGWNVHLAYLSCIGVLFTREQKQWRRQCSETTWNVYAGDEWCYGQRGGSELEFGKIAGSQLLYILRDAGDAQHLLVSRGSHGADEQSDHFPSLRPGELRDVCTTRRVHRLAVRYNDENLRHSRHSSAAVFCVYTVFQKTCDHIFDDKSVYNNFWHTYYQEYRPSTGVFVFPPHLFCVPTLPWETGKT